MTPEERETLLASLAIPELIRAAVAAERKACALLCERIAPTTHTSAQYMTAQECAIAIRTRGQP